MLMARIPFYPPLGMPNNDNYFEVPGSISKAQKYLSLKDTTCQ